MDKILEIIKEKLESPILTNFFVGLLLFNKKVIYTALFTNYNDSINGIYKYDQQQVYNKIELLGLVHKDEKYWNLDSSWNLFLLPLIYAAVITGLLPYIKSCFKAINDNADILFTNISIWLNKKKFVLEEEYKKLEFENEKLNNDKDDLVKLNRNIREESEGIKKEVEKKEIDFKKSNDEINNLTNSFDTTLNEFETAKKDYNKLLNTIKNKEQTMAEIFRAVWKLDFRFEPPSDRGSGVEYFKIVNGCEIHTSDGGYNGNYKFIGFIDRYNYEINAVKYIDLPTNPDGQILNRIKFKKNFSEDYYAMCEYTLISEESIKGEEFVTFDKGVTIHKSTVILTRPKDF
jgi:hypothetical protein